MANLRLQLLDETGAPLAGACYGKVIEDADGPAGAFVIFRLPGNDNMLISNSNVLIGILTSVAGLIRKSILTTFQFAPRIICMILMCGLPYVPVRMRYVRNRWP